MGIKTNIFLVMSVIWICNICCKNHELLISRTIDDSISCCDSLVTVVQEMNSFGLVKSSEESSPTISSEGASLEKWFVANTSDYVYKGFVYGSMGKAEYSYYYHRDSLFFGQSILMKYDKPMYIEGSSIVKRDTVNYCYLEGVLDQICDKSENTSNEYSKKRDEGYNKILELCRFNLQ